MAEIIIFPDRDSLEGALKLSGTMDMHMEPMEIPTFCRGIAAPCLVTTAGLKRVVGDLESRGVRMTAAIPYKTFKRDVPQAPPPDPQWLHIVGGIHIHKVQPSFTDPQRLRIEAIPGNDLGELIPFMARLIRGGVYRPQARVLALEEEHRFIVFQPHSVVVSRADDLLDAWIMLRCSVDLICSAWNKRNVMEPDKDPRYGIGAIEIFRRLPGDNCGQCRCGNCMEFAQSVFTGRRRVVECGPLLEERNSPSLESMRWLGDVIGVSVDGPAPGGNSSE